jgi:protoheme ferro-lyase
MKRIITLCRENSVLLVLMKMVHIITTVLQTVEKHDQGNWGKMCQQQLREKQTEHLKQQLKGRKRLCRLTLRSS